MSDAKLCFVALGILALAGCSPLEQRRESLSEIMNPEPRESSYQSNDENGGPRLSRGKITSETVAPAGTYAHTLSLASANPRDPDLARTFLRAGVSLSNEVCSAWLSKLGEAQSQIAVEKDFLGSVGLLTSTLLGATRADSKLITISSAGFEFSRSMISSSEANYIVAPSIALIQKLVEQERRAVKLDIFAEAVKPGYSYWDARSHLIDYDNTCSHLSIRRLVSEKLGGTDGRAEVELKALASRMAEQVEIVRKSVEDANAAAATAQQAAQKATDPAEKARLEKLTRAAEEAARKASEELKAVEARSQAALKAKADQITATAAATVAAANASQAAVAAKQATINLEQTPPPEPSIHTPPAESR
jgi:hypothetical protein